MNALHIAVAQFDFLVGDVSGNTKKIIHLIQQARDTLKADLIVFPELALSGYPAEDLLLRNDFHQQIEQALSTICEKTTGICVLLGHPQYQHQKIFNAASVIQNKKIIATYHKQHLPNYGVFDEHRYFQPGHAACLFTVKEIKIGVIICEDNWHTSPTTQAVKNGAQLIVSINASPFDACKNETRKKILFERIAENKVPIIYVNCVGAQDDLVFDGGSMAINANGQIIAQADFFKEKLLAVQIEKTLQIKASNIAPALSQEASIYEALVLSVRDYAKKNNFIDVLVAVSGGIDSGLTLAIAVDAVGKDRVQAISLPSRYTSDLSKRLTAILVKALDVQTRCISIEPLFQATLKSLMADAESRSQDKMKENVQARCRSILLMGLANQSGKILLNSSNKSELATGYSTLYGDLAGGYAPLKDVSKTLVYRLAHYRNSISAVIPEEMITREPTAELAENQKDEDTLPPYSVLDAVLEMYVEQDKSMLDIVAAGFEKETVKQIIGRVNCNEYKRRQAPPGPRITTRAFGRERRYPITAYFFADS